MAEPEEKQRQSSKHEPDAEATPKSSGEFNSRAILTLIGSSLSLFCTVGFLNAFGVFLDWYHRHQLSDKSEFDISWIGSFCTFTFFLAAVPAGLIFDRTGPTVSVLGGAIVMEVALFMVSLCKEYYQFFLAQGLLLGIGQAFVTCPAIASISRHFDKNRGLATGFTIAGSSLGGVIWPIMMDQLLNKDNISFPWTIRIVAFTMLPILLAAAAMIRPITTHKPLDGEKASVAPQESGHPNNKKPKKVDLSIAKNRVFLTLAAGLAIFYFGFFTPFFYTTSYAVSIGMGTSFSFYLVSILNAASLVGRISAGWAADKYGHFNLCSLAAVSSAIVVFCWTAVTTSAGLVVWAMAYGFVSGSIMSLQTSCGTKLATPETVGTAIGMILGMVSLTGLFGSPISGELIKYGYLELSMFAGAMLVIGAILICSSRLLQSRRLFAIV